MAITPDNLFTKPFHQLCIRIFVCKNLYSEHGYINKIIPSDTDTTTYCSVPEIENGYVSPLSSAIDETEYYIIYCNSGYSIDGINTMFCLENGSLSSAANCAG